MTTFRGISGGMLAVFFAASASAQPAAPSPGAPAPSGTAAFGATAPAAQGESPPAQPGAPTPAATAPPQVQPAPQAYAPPQSYPPQTYPPPQNYSPPPSNPPPTYSTSSSEAPSPERDATAAAATNRLQPGPYFGAWFGVGAPFGGDATTGRGVGYKEGPGGLATLGWAFIPNFGVDLFVHYNATGLAIDESAQQDVRLDESAGHVWLYGLEARGIIGSGPMLAWASLGISLGSGSLTTSQSGTPSFSSSSITAHSEDQVRFKPMPVLSLGAEIEVARGLGLGPQLRWYITNVEYACDSTNETLTDSTIGPATTQNISDTRCGNVVSDTTVPDIVFLGAGLTYRVGT